MLILAEWRHQSLKATHVLDAPQQVKIDFKDEKGHAINAKLFALLKIFMNVFWLLLVISLM